MEPSGQNLTTLLDRLRETHRNGVNAFRPGTSMNELRARAAELGASLLEVAESNNLWTALTPTQYTHPEGPTDDQRPKLRAAIANIAVGINWAEVLERIGYQPPPSPDEYRKEFAEAVTQGFDGDFRIDRLRDQLRQLAEQLNTLSRDPKATPQKIRRVVWKSLRIAGSIAIAAAVSMAVAPIVAPLAAGVAGSAIVAAMGLPVAVVTDFVLEAAKEACVKVVDKLLERPDDDDDSEEMPGDPAFRALALADDMSEPVLLGLRRSWIPRTAGDAEKIATKAFIDRTRQLALGVGANAVGTTWFSDTTREQWTAVQNNLNRLETHIGQQPLVRSDIITALGSLATDLPVFKTLLRHDVAPLTPSEERDVRIAACQKLITELHDDIEAADRQAAPTRTNLALAMKTHRTDAQRLAQLRAAVTECEAVTDVLVRLRESTKQRQRDFKQSPQP